jgi:cell division protein FtsQ
VFALRADGVRVTIDGAYVDAAAVDAAIASFVGTPLTRLDVGEVERAVETAPGVASVEVSRAWTHGLVVAVEGSEPVAAVPIDGGVYVLVDARGATLATQGEAPADLPVIEVPLGDGSGRTLAAALAVAGALPAPLAARVEIVRAETEDSVVLDLRDGPRIEWGSAEDSRLKGAVAVLLLTSDAGMNASIIDVSAPTLPVVRD